MNEQIRAACFTWFVFCSGAQAMNQQEKIALNKHLVNAASEGDRECVDALLNAGANVNFEFYGDTALEQAAYGGHHEIVARLIQGGAYVNYISSNDKTALLSALDQCHIETVATLIKAGADVYHVYGFWGTPLIIASLYKSYPICELLLGKMLTISDEAQKKKLCIFLHCLKNAYPRDFSHLRQLFRMPSKAAMWHDNATNPESRPRKEIDKIANQEIKESLLNKYCRESK